MSGHRPFSDLTKRFTPEQWRRIKEGAAKMNAEIEAAEAAAKQPKRAAAKRRQPQEATRASGG